MDGVMPIYDLYKAAQYNGGAVTGYRWDAYTLKYWFSQVRCGGYKKHVSLLTPYNKSLYSSCKTIFCCSQYLIMCAIIQDCYHRFLKYKHVFSKMKGIVIGSELPWAEAQALRLGATEVSTIEFMPIVSEVPHLHTFTPQQVADLYMASMNPAHDRNKTDTWLFGVDFAISYSSLEHTGLGRYGDPLNPDGDIEAVRRVRCMLRIGGIFFLALPTGADSLVWNAHRVYGRNRLPLLFEGFEVLDVLGHMPDIVNRTNNSVHEITYGVHQPIWVLMKKA
jgi:hypothetical protein